MVVFKEIRERIGLDIQISPMIASLNMVNDNWMKKEEKEFIIIMVTVARLILAKNWKHDNLINIEEWYREM